ncbi:hypothetical protein B0I33_10952 [Prauserella shujinwangii]|uniref:Uncharacterized protein n=1 Tax=Prauserella shujinwangii TaxID=1453103 RepID=A0A2T0LPY5_9PSEU|nr:permease prefix domain 1-containing protein [Prauserella shujinwangii]PRX45389.1 hypothetical protein B0I33_10952 [Prauserella shujinwangii]
MTAGPVDTVTDTLARSLRGPHRARREMVREVRDGLGDATEAYQATGLSPAEAERRAVADFGDPQQVAGELQAELTARYGRRTAALMAVAFPGLVLLWDLLWALDPTPDGRALEPHAALLARAVDLLSLAAAGGSLVVAATLWLGARRGSRPELVTRGAGLLAFGTLAAVGGTSVLLNVLSGADRADATYDSPLAVVVAATTGCVACWLAVSGHRCLRLGRPRDRQRTS